MDELYQIGKHLTPSHGKHFTGYYTDDFYGGLITFGVLLTKSKKAFTYTPITINSDIDEITIYFGDSEIIERARNKEITDYDFLEAKNSAMRRADALAERQAEQEREYNA
jgi:hypothetical protein